MVIRILDYVETASSYEDGQIIYTLIVESIKRNEDVILSFDSIPSVPSAFINSALLQLLEEFPFQKIKEKLMIKDTTKHINELINSRFNFVISKSISTE